MFQFGFGRLSIVRASLRAEWNMPVRWPIYLVLIAIVAVTVPAVRTYYRERL